MAKSVISAFEEFLKNTINLDAEQVKKARNSRDWLIEEIKKFPEKNEKFPDFYLEKNINFGSFARKTKKRPLDDIDIMICLNAKNGTYYEHTHDDIKITINSEEKNYKHYVIVILIT